MNVKKELRDQSAHFAVGFVATILFQFFMPVLAAAGLVMGVALLRERFQHRMRSFWRMGMGSVRDLFFWLLGTGLAVGLVLAEVI